MEKYRSRKKERRGTNQEKTYRQQNLNSYTPVHIVTFGRMVEVLKS